MFGREKFYFRLWLITFLAAPNLHNVKFRDLTINGHGFPLRPHLPFLPKKNALETPTFPKFLRNLARFIIRTKLKSHCFFFHYILTLNPKNHPSSTRQRLRGLSRENTKERKKKKKEVTRDTGRKHGSAVPTWYYTALISSALTMLEWMFTVL